MSAPVKNTCPDIDKCIKEVRVAIKAAERGRKEHPEADDYFYDILCNIEDLEGRLEDLRSDNSELRSWGHWLQEELHSLAQQLEDIETKPQ